MIREANSQHWYLSYIYRQLDNAASVAIVKHSLLLGKSLIDYLNPGQIPVQSMNQSIYAIEKQIQWKWNEETTTLCKGASEVANLFDILFILWDMDFK